LDEDIRALLEGHPATTGDLPVKQVLNVDLLEVAIIGDPIVPALAPDPSGQGRIRPLGIAAANRRTPAVKLANFSVRAALVLGARSPTSPSCPAAGSAPSS
jgi:hypothetical protein